MRQGFARQLAVVLVVGVLPHGMLFGLAGRLANAITMFRGLIYNAEGQLPEERAVVAALAATEVRSCCRCTCVWTHGFAE